MDKKEIIKTLKKEIQLQLDDDYWQEIKVNGKYYDCNIYYRAGYEPDFCNNSDPNDLKVAVYGVEKDKFNPGFRTTNTDNEKFSFTMPSAEKEIVVDFNSTLVIHNVNLELLEKQRQALIDLEAGLPDGYGLEALQGVIEMLDKWADKEYLRNKKVSDGKI